MQILQELWSDNSTCTIYFQGNDENERHKDSPTSALHKREKCKQLSTTTKINQENSCLLARRQMINSSNNTYVGMVHINAVNTWEIKKNKMKQNGYMMNFK